MHVCHVQKLHAARPDSVLKGSSGHALLCGQQWLAEGSPLHSTRDDSLAHRQAQRKRSAVLKIVNQNCCLPEIEIQEALLVKQISLNIIILADNKTARHFRDRHEVIDDDSEAYCWRRSGFFWRMRASLGLACAQATTLASQVFGKGNPRSRAGRTSA